MSTESHILVVDDDPDIAKAARLLLERHGMRVSTAASPEAAWVLLAGEPVDVILLDLNFARGRTTGEEGFAMLDRLIAGDARAVVIVVTGHSGIAVAVRAMRSGATDFVIKPWNNERLLTTVERGLALRRAKLETAATPRVPDGILLGESPGIGRARDLIARVAPTAAPILVHGAAGTGKTLIARLIHQASAHAHLPLVTLDAEAADAAVIAAQMAVIAAQTTAAAGGMLVIDHIDRLPRALHGALLAALDGIRVVATTRLDRAGLRAAIGEDLLDRVGTIEIALPPLVDRTGDALLLARHFLALFAYRHGKPNRPLGDDAAHAIATERWPDNVRGLRQTMERAVLLGNGEAYAIADFRLSPDMAEPQSLAPDLSLARNEETLITAALERHAFNVSRAAAQLGLTRAALYRRMARYGL
ncbi:MAG: sigma-54-dependent Fis family transcriptional regulator [Sphingomonas taxi]|uniref:Sigma-54-dependent Fis family transcriptional regulator n=1 Tax=Sphingomonas taxi TaxID=1549858 RepID=A0A2W4Z117_9SPHN|nr:MAG: sigma-54-dependent Fis family transcriptional regulator [Sphingomonas taxi]